MQERAKILVVDDEELNVHIVTETLEAEYDITSALGGQEAIMHLAKDSPDLILLDVMMPVVNGFEVCKIIKANPRLEAVPIIFLTGYDSQESQISALEVGGIDYLTKPLDLTLLRLRVRNQIELKRKADLIAQKNRELDRANHQLNLALQRVKRLEGLIPICMYCKKIRNDEEIWEQLEAYLESHTDARFSHGICDDCFEVHYPTA